MHCLYIKISFFSVLKVFSFPTLIFNQGKLAKTFIPDVEEQQFANLNMQ